MMPPQAALMNIKLVYYVDNDGKLAQNSTVQSTQIQLTWKMQILTTRTDIWTKWFNSIWGVTPEEINLNVTSQMYLLIFSAI